MYSLLPLFVVAILLVSAHCHRASFRLNARTSRVQKPDTKPLVAKKEVINTADILQNTRKLMSLSSSRRTKDKDKLLLRETLEDREILSFIRNGHLFLPQLFNPSVITDALRPACLAYEKSRGSALSAYRHKVKVQLDYKGTHLLTTHLLTHSLTHSVR